MLPAQPAELRLEAAAPGHHGAGARHRRAARLGHPVSAAETIASLLPDARLVVFEKSGHSPQTEERELFLSTVRGSLGHVVPAA